MCSVFLLCAVLRALHSVKLILNVEECRSIGEAEIWWDDELAVIIAGKPPSVVQETMEMLGREYVPIANRIWSKLCST